MVRRVTTADIGCKVLYEPAGDTRAEEVVDIVAVHGIGAHPDDTWSQLRHGDLDAKDPNSYIHWLKDPEMLPKVVPNARIMRYGYLSAWFGPDEIKANASILGQRLLRALQRLRKEQPRRPLIFIAHCFGGLVVLKALLDANDNPKEWPSIQSTTGLISFGTPFRGAVGLSQSEILQAALSQYEQPEVLRILDPGNELLHDLVDRFSRIRSGSKKIEVSCFFELQGSDVGIIVGKELGRSFIVSQDSGCLDLSAETRKYSLARDHFNMNKFSTPSDEDYETVADEVARMVGAAPQLILARQQDEHGHDNNSLSSRLGRALGNLVYVDDVHRWALALGHHLAAQEYLTSWSWKQQQSHVQLEQIESEINEILQDQQLIPLLPLQADSGPLKNTERMIQEVKRVAGDAHLAFFLIGSAVMYLRESARQVISEDSRVEHKSVARSRLDGIALHCRRRLTINRDAFWNILLEEDTEALTLGYMRVLLSQAESI